MACVASSLEMASCKVKSYYFCDGILSCKLHCKPAETQEVRYQTNYCQKITLLTK